MDVYGLAAAHQIKNLGDAILDADYEKILASTNQFAEMDWISTVPYSICPNTSGRNY